MGQWRFFNHLRGLWLDFSFDVGFSKVLGTGYTKPLMLFKRPVDDEFKISAHYGDTGPWWSKHMDAAGRWLDGQIDGIGQHKGVDFSVPVGTLVYAMYDGIVVRAGWENLSDPKQGFGLRVRQQIVTDGGVPMTLVYGHLSVLHAHEGHQIVKGDRIGISGRSGHVTGAHLHVELVDGKGQYHPILFEDPPKTPA